MVSAEGGAYKGCRHFVRSGRYDNFDRIGGAVE